MSYQRRGRKLPRKQLSVKTERFIENMSKPGISKHQAALQAGFTRGNTEANRILKNPKIYQRIEDRKRLAAEFCGITPEAILGATALRAFASIDDAFDDHGNFDIQKARETGAIHLIKKLEKNQFGFKVEFYAADTAQERLGNYLGLDKAPADNNDISSLRTAVEEVSIAMAEGGEVTPEIRRGAWGQVLKWATEKRAKYSQNAIQELSKEYAQ
jgi:hypothetical protein